MKKRVNLRRVTSTAKLLLKSNIVLKVNLVIGFPNERLRDVFKSILYGMKLSLYGVDSVIFHRFVPYPGSSYFEELQRAGTFPEHGPRYDAFLSTNTYNELSNVKSFSRHISDTAIKILLYLGFILTISTYMLSHPFQAYKMFGRIMKNQANSPIENILVTIANSIKKKLKLS